MQGVVEKACKVGQTEVRNRFELSRWVNNCFITSDKRKKRSRFRGKLRLRFLVDGGSNLRDNYRFHYIIVNHRPLNHPRGVTFRRRLIAQTKIWSEDTFRLIRAEGAVVEGMVAFHPVAASIRSSCLWGEGPTPFIIPVDCYGPVPALIYHLAGEHCDL